MSLLEQARDGLEALRARRRLAHAYRDCFEAPAGRLVLADLLRQSGILEVSHAPGDAYETAYREGRRSMALELLNRLRWTEMELLALARERTSETLAAMEGA